MVLYQLPRLGLLLLLPFAVQETSARLYQSRGNGDLDSLQDNSKTKKALLVDISGPNSSVGEGVREMGMLVDLRGAECQYEVDVLSICDNCSVNNYRWQRTITAEYLHGVNVYNFATFKTAGPGLDSYDKIIVGGKLNVLRDPPATELIDSVLDELASNQALYREKTFGFWDDVPFVRCTYKDLCPQVPALVSKFAKAVREFYVLTPGDQMRMQEEMMKNHIEAVPVTVWPMRFDNMLRLAPPVVNFRAFSDVDLAGKKYLTLLGNFHPVNKLNLAQFVEKGVARICDKIREEHSHVRLLILGGIAEFADHAVAKLPPQDMDCVEIQKGFVDNEVLDRTIYPNTRAFVNPFFFDVESGISVKSFESVKDGMPFLTSTYGLHGISEIHECRFPTAAEPTPESFTDFIIQNVISNAKYTHFAKLFDHENCMKGQMKQYPLGAFC